MENQKSKSTFSTILLTLTLMVAALGVSSAAVAAEKKMVKDPTTDEMVSASEYGGTLTVQLQAWAGAVDPYFGYPNTGPTDGVGEKLGIMNWAVD